MSEGSDARPVRIAVIGTSQADAEQSRCAEEVGRLLAEAGAVLLCGGLGGVMEAASRGAARAGGTVVGLLPGMDAAAANPYVTLPLSTGLGEARNMALVHSGEAVIAVGGGHGTLSEIAFALRAGKAVFGLGTWQLASVGGVGVEMVATPQQAVGRALAAARDLSS